MYFPEEISVFTDNFQTEEGKRLHGHRSWRPSLWEQQHMEILSEQEAGTPR